VLLPLCFCSVPVTAQTFATLVTFDGTDGAIPSASLAQGNDGDLYGTTLSGGSSGKGTIFKVTPAGALTSVYSFTGGSDGGGAGALVIASDGNFYGTTQYGGVNNHGTVFRLTVPGALTTLHSFTGGADGGAPSSLLQATDGNFYGTTSSATNIVPTIFRLTPRGTLTTLYSFVDATHNGAPGGLIQATDGNFYGTTGGININGTVFRLTSAGRLTTLYSFCSGGSIPFCPDGDEPDALIQGQDGSFYGTTAFGGGGNAGTVFRLTSAGTLTNMYTFSGGSDGLGPGHLIQGRDGNFYGITALGGADNGTIFRLTSGRTLTTLYDFCSQGAFSGCPDGLGQGATLVQAGDGNFYGTTQFGGTARVGTVFGLATTLIPPTTNPSIGAVVNSASFQTGIVPNSWVTIFGTNLASATDDWGSSIINGSLPTSLDGVTVRFGGQAAYVAYISPTQINVLAPAVATGMVEVTVTNSGNTGAAVSVVSQTAQPAFFQWGSYAVATHLDYSLAVKNGAIAGVVTVPAKPGETIILWGTGCGPTSPSAPVGIEVPFGPTYYAASAVTVTVGSAPANGYGAALSPGYAGLYQVAIQIPTSLADGDYQVVATVSGVQSPSSTLIAVQH